MWLENGTEFQRIYTYVCVCVWVGGIDRFRWILDTRLNNMSFGRCVVCDGNIEKRSV